jgi:hypothetical protein
LNLVFARGWWFQTLKIQCQEQTELTYFQRLTAA